MGLSVKDIEDMKALTAQGNVGVPRLHFSEKQARYNPDAHKEIHRITLVGDSPESKLRTPFMPLREAMNLISRHLGIPAGSDFPFPIMAEKQHSGPVSDHSSYLSEYHLLPLA